MDSKRRLGVHINSAYNSHLDHSHFAAYVVVDPENGCHTFLTIGGDGHNWRRKKDGKNVGEAHERLKGKHSAGPISTLTLGPSNIIQRSNNYATQLASSAGPSEFDETYNSTPGPSFLDGNPCKRLSLEHVKENGTFYNENEYPDDLGFTYNEQNYSGFEEFHYVSDNSVSLQYPGSAGEAPFWRYWYKLRLQGGNPISDTSFLIHNASASPLAIPLNSASALDNDTTFCFLHLHVTRLPHTKEKYPGVDRLFPLSLAQSASVYI
nr:hypothetical protein [Tanacetum cinerariifolium]